MPSQDMGAYMLRRYHARRAEAVRLLGGACIKCGTTERLEFDHIDPASKEFTIGGSAWNTSKARFLAEVAKCQLLCATHHAEKSITDRGFKPARKR